MVKLQGLGLIEEVMRRSGSEGAVGWGRMEAQKLFSSILHSTAATNVIRPRWNAGRQADKQACILDGWLVTGWVGGLLGEWVGDDAHLKSKELWCCSLLTLGEIQVRK